MLPASMISRGIPYTVTQGGIDAYPEYTGTIAREILKNRPARPRRR